MMSITSQPAIRPASCVALRRGSLKYAGTVMTHFDNGPSCSFGVGLELSQDDGLQHFRADTARRGSADDRTREPMSRFGYGATRSGSNSADFTASLPTTTPDLSKNTTLGVVRSPSELAIVTARPCASR